MTGLEVGAILLGVIVGIALLVWGVYKLFWREFI